MRIEAVLRFARVYMVWCVCAVYASPPVASAPVPVLSYEFTNEACNAGIFRDAQNTSVDILIPPEAATDVHCVKKEYKDHQGGTFEMEGVHAHACISSTPLGETVANALTTLLTHSPDSEALSVEVWFSSPVDLPLSERNRSDHYMRGFHVSASDTFKAAAPANGLYTDPNTTNTAFNIMVRRFSLGLGFEEEEVPFSSGSFPSIHASVSSREEICDNVMIGAVIPSTVSISEYEGSEGEEIWEYMIVDEENGVFSEIPNDAAEATHIQDKHSVHTLVNDTMQLNKAVFTFKSDDDGAGIVRWYLWNSKLPPGELYYAFAIDEYSGIFHFFGENWGVPKWYYFHPDAKIHVGCEPEYDSYQALVQYPFPGYRYFDTDASLRHSLVLHKIAFYNQSLDGEQVKLVFGDS